MYLMVSSHLIVKFPFLYKTTGPLNYTTPVLSYLYVRAILNNEKRFYYKDLIHFIPFFFFVLYYIPFYILPNSDKLIIVQSISYNINLAQTYTLGLIQEKYSFFLIPVQTTYYLILQWSLIVKFKKDNKFVEVQKQIKIVIKWIKVFTLASTFFVIGYVFLIIGALNINDFFNTNFPFLIPGLTISISFLVISFYLLVNSEALSGMPFIKYQEITSTIFENNSNKIPFIEYNYVEQIKLINNYFVNEKKFQIQKLHLSIVAVSLNIPVRDLSYIINNYYELNFNDFVNKFRIEYIINKLTPSNLELYTIDALSKEAGFSSKSSFYRAFNKIHQITPLQYIENFIQKTS